MAKVHRAAAILPQTPTPDIAALERQVVKLQKINAALMGQVERSMNSQGNAFSLFQTAIVLENQVGERTKQLEDVLSELEASNRALTVAKETAETAQTRLALAIEAGSEGFALFDRHDRLVLSNAKFRECWPLSPDVVEPGLSYRDLLRHVVNAGLVPAALDDPEGWINARSRHQLTHPEVLRVADGRWIQISEQRTPDGGIAAIYTDITEIKHSETQRRERELAEKSVLLQATLDNIDQGISVFDRDSALTAWNDRFVDLLGLEGDGEKLTTGLTLDTLLARSAQSQGTNGDCYTLLAALGDFPTDAPPPPLSLEHRCTSGHILEVRRNPMPDGGFVATYTDITRRIKTQEALRDSERRMRLVTDAMPALIAYVDENECFQFTNQAYEVWFDRPRSQINGLPMRQVLGETHYAQRGAYVKRALAGEGVTFEMSMPTDRRAIQYALATYVPHIDNHGHVKGFFALIQDITEQRKAAEALQEAKDSLEQRVAERTAELLALNSELADAKASADEANLSKTRFLAAASHDLLQPLNAARVFAAALSERDLRPENQRLVGNITHALEAVDELLSALLEISKLDAGVMPIDVKDIAISEVLESLYQENAAFAASRGNSLRYVDHKTVVRTDPQLLARILRNFLSNAIRYTPQGPILMGCRRHGNKLRVGIWDTGIGIPGDKLGEIFQEFKRLRNDDSLIDNGVGLGLAIVDRIARRLALSIFVQSQPGKGSFFAVDLPLGDPAQVAPYRRNRDSNQPHPATGGGGATILMVDNEPTILAAMQSLLSNWSYDTALASSTNEAISAARQLAAPPDLIIADFHLNDGDVGLDTIRSVRQLWQRQIPAIVITADHSKEVLARVKQLDGYVLNKPLKPAKLRSLLAHLLSQSCSQERPARATDETPPAPPTPRH